MSGLGELRRASGDPARDLWPRFRERLADGDRVELQIPDVTWGVMAAGIVVAGVLALVPEPARLLAASGLL